MLSSEERSDIEVMMEHYPNKRAAAIDALKVVLRRRGWVSDEGLRDLSALLEMSPEDLDAVASFYNLIFRKPVGRHVILICNSVSCWVMGYETLCQELKSRLGIDLGQTTYDGRFTLLPNVCLGACDHAPAMMVDEDFYGDVHPSDLPALLEQYA